MRSWFVVGRFMVSIQQSDSHSFPVVVSKIRIGVVAVTHRSSRWPHEDTCSRGRFSGTTLQVFQAVLIRTSVLACSPVILLIRSPWPFWLRPFGSSPDFRDFVFCLFHSITISDAQQSSVEAGRGSSRVGRARGSATSSVAPCFARSPSSVSSTATCASPAAIASAWAHRSERGSEEHSEIPDHEDSRTSSFVDASAKQTKASDFKFFGDTEGPEVDGLRAALKRAESDPIHTQVKESHFCKGLDCRLRKEVNQKRAVASISDAEKRSARCIIRGTEVAGTCVSVASQTRCPRPRPRCALRAHGETVLPVGSGSCSDALMPKSIPAALSTGLEDRRSHEWRDRTCLGIEFQNVRRCRASDGDHWWHVFVKVRVAVSRGARCGYRGQRVREASHPGPVRRLRRSVDVRNVFPRLATQSQQWRTAMTTGLSCTFLHRIMR